MPVRASMTLQPCFLAAEMKERMLAKSSAPSVERKPGRRLFWIFWRSFIMRSSRSASLLVKGTVGSQEAQRVLLARHQPQQQIAPGSARRAAASFAGALFRQRRLGFVEGEPFGDDGVVAALEPPDCDPGVDEAGLQEDAALAREIGGVTGKAQQALHLARHSPSFTGGTMRGSFRLTRLSLQPRRKTIRRRSAYSPRRLPALRARARFAKQASQKRAAVLRQ